MYISCDNVQFTVKQWGNKIRAGNIVNAIWNSVYHRKPAFRLRYC